MPAEIGGRTYYLPATVPYVARVEALKELAGWYGKKRGTHISENSPLLSPPPPSPQFPRAIFLKFELVGSS